MQVLPALILEMAVGSRRPSSGWPALRLGLIMALISVLQSLFGAEYIIVIDTSGSMGGTISSRDSRPRLPVVKEALQDFLKGLENESHVTLIPFNTGITRIDSFNFSIEGDRQQALDSVAGLTASGSTALWTTVKVAFERAVAARTTNPDMPVTVWVLTDGNDTQGVTTLDKVLREFPQVDPKNIPTSLVILGDFQFYLNAESKRLIRDGRLNVVNAPDFGVIAPLEFEWSPQPVRVGVPITFKQKSGGKFPLYRWSFGGGVEYGPQVTKVFDRPGRVHVKLVVSTTSGGENSVGKDIEVLEKELPPLQPRVVRNVLKPEPEQNVIFEVSAARRPAKVQWLLDGAPAFDGPVWSTKFVKVGRYTVVAKTTDEKGREESSPAESIEVAEPVAAAQFRALKDNVEDGEEAQFINESSSNLVTFRWDYGDGTTSDGRDGLHSYRNASSVAKNYTITLHAFTATKRPFTATKQVQVAAEKRPIAQFEVVGGDFVTGQMIQFRNLSTGGAPNGDEWDFNGEQRSTDHDPEVSFPTAGLKTVSLTVKGPTGIRQSAPPVTITIAQRQFNVSVRWLDAKGQSRTTSPGQLDFDEVPLALVQKATFKDRIYGRPDYSTFEVAVPEGLPNDAAVEVALDGASGAGFRLVNVMDETMTPLVSSRLRTATAVRVELDPKVNPGAYIAKVIVRPIGAGVQINSANAPVEFAVKGTVTTGESGSLLVWIIGLLALLGIGYATYRILKRPPPIRGPVTVQLIEVPTDKAAETKPPGDYLLEQPTQSIYLGRDDNTPSEAQVYDIGAADIFVMHQGSYLSLCNRNMGPAPRRISDNETYDVNLHAGGKKKIQVRLKPYQSPPET